MNAAIERQFGKGAVDVTVDEKQWSLDYINYDDAFDDGYYLGEQISGESADSTLNVYDMTEVPGVDEIVTIAEPQCKVQSQLK